MSISHGADYWGVSTFHQLPKAERKTRNAELGDAGLIQRFQTEQQAKKAVLAAGIDPAAAWIRISLTTPVYGVL